MDLKIKEFRLKERITQEELANRCNKIGDKISQQYLSELEKPTIERKYSPTIDSLIIISMALNLKCPLQLIDCGCRKCDNCDKRPKLKKINKPKKY